MDAVQEDFLKGRVYLFVILAALWLALPLLTLTQTVIGAEVVIGLSREITGP